MFPIQQTVSKIDLNEATSSLDGAVAAVEKLRIALLFEGSDRMTPMAEQHFLDAMAKMDSAQRSLKSADYCFMQKM